MLPRLGAIEVNQQASARHWREPSPALGMLEEEPKICLLPGDFILQTGAPMEMQNDDWKRQDKMNGLATHLFRKMEDIFIFYLYLKTRDINYTYMNDYILNGNILKCIIQTIRKTW